MSTLEGISKMQRDGDKYIKKDHYGPFDLMLLQHHNAVHSVAQTIDHVYGERERERERESVCVYSLARSPAGHQASVFP